MPSLSQTRLRHYASLKPGPKMAAWVPPKASPTLASVLIPEQDLSLPMFRQDYLRLLAARVQGMVDALPEDDARSALMALLPPEGLWLLDLPLTQIADALMFETDLVMSGPLGETMPPVSAWPVTPEAVAESRKARVATASLRGWLRAAFPEEPHPTT